MAKHTRNKTHDRSRWLAVFVFGVFIRIVLICSGMSEVFSRRVEVVSPITSLYRVTECVTLSRNGISPYSGDICHQPPLLIYLFQCIPSLYYQALFLVIDVLTAVVLFMLAQMYTKTQLKTQETNKPTYATDVSLLLLDAERLQAVPLMVMSVYLFNLYSLVSCVAQSTVILNNLITAIFLFSMLKGWYFAACSFVAVSTYLSLYPVMLIVPVLLHAYQNTSLKHILGCLAVFSASIAMLLILSFKLNNSSWNFLHAVYGFILEAPDLTPNMGLFWYFFLEMFDHFRLFFLWVYQINVFIYVIPVAIVFRKQPLLVCYTLLSLITLFKSYSNFGDLCLPMALLPLWSYIYKYMRNVLLIIGMFIFTSILAPCMWYLWIYAGSGNANFFYAVTLAYSTAQVFLLADVLYAFLKHDFHLTNGLTPKTKDGKEGVVLMK